MDTFSRVETWIDENKGLAVDFLQPVSYTHLDVYKRQLYGLAGSGATETAEMIMGLLRPLQGSVFMGGKKLLMKNINESMNAGIGYVPSDRRQEGIIVNMPISQNNILANLDSYDGRVMLNYKKIETRVAVSYTHLDVYKRQVRRGMSVRLHDPAHGPEQPAV